MSDASLLLHKSSLPAKVILALCVCVLLLSTGQAQGQNFIVVSSRYLLQKVNPTPIAHALYMTEPDEGTQRQFIVEQEGYIWIIQNGVQLDQPFLDIHDMIDMTDFESGLLGLAFDPAFTQNGVFYITHTLHNQGQVTLARYHVSKTDPNQADASSRAILLTTTQPRGHHNGGMITFGPGGYLYMSAGDGGMYIDSRNQAQYPSKLLGSILRLDVRDTQAASYAIPADNPYADGQQGAPEVWAKGLRNPWRFSFDRETNDLYIGDVGESATEEIDYLPADYSGLPNFGWPVYEGKQLNDQYALSGSAIPETNFIAPVTQYSHGADCAVAGGYVYRGQALPELRGTYLFGDFCSGNVRWLKRAVDGSWASGLLFDTNFTIVSLAQDPSGELYIIDHASGVYKLTSASALNLEPVTLPALANGRMENGESGTLDAWTPQDRATQVCDADADEGQCAALIQSGGSLWQSLDVVPNTAFSLRFFARASQADAALTMSLEWQLDDGTSVDARNLEATVPSSWQRFEENYVVPAHAVKAIVGLRAAKGTDGLEYWVDNVGIQDNLLLNGDFQRTDGGQPLSWKTTGTPSYRCANSEAGSAAACFVTVDTDNNYFQEVSIAPGTYALRLDARADAPANGRLQVNWIDQAGRYISTHIDVYPATTEWQRFVLNVQPPPNAVTAVIYANSHTGTVDVRNVSFTQTYSFQNALP